MSPSHNSCHESPLGSYLKPWTPNSPCPPRRQGPPHRPKFSNWFHTPNSQGQPPWDPCAIPTPTTSSHSYFLLCWRIQTNYLHMCAWRSLMGDGGQEEYTADGTQTPAPSDFASAPRAPVPPLALAAIGRRHSSIPSAPSFISPCCFRICTEEADGSWLCSLRYHQWGNLSEECLCFSRLFSR